jgi:hypothetical protein
MKNLRIEERNKNLASVNPHSNEFNFEIWAQQVRDRMLGVLQKKTNSRSAIGESNRK